VSRHRWRRGFGAFWQGAARQHTRAGLRRIPYLRVTWSPQRGKIENSGGHVKKIKKKSLDAMTLVAVLLRRHEK
jgi:NADPH-dependent 2,4-dienoyl-CoA reductase/sulfur reductase-like enzyme